MKLMACSIGLRRSVLAGILGFSAPVLAIDSATILASTFSLDCIEYRVVGICYWLLCTPVGCSVKTSVKVRHFIPEAVVSSYAVIGNNPWTDMSLYSAPNPTAQDGGSGTTNYARENEMTTFKNVDAIGHPGSALSKIGAQTGYVCAGATQPLVPYFLSTLDTLAWRYGVPESVYPQALIPGLREVGDLLQGTTWGNVYPREGFLHQVDDHKAAAVMAQRAGDVATRKGQPHVYVPMVAKAKAGYWPAEPMVEGDITNHKWQELVPTLRPTCAVFPSSELLDQAIDGGYAWTLWRPYSCCKRRGQTFLGSVDFL